MKATYQIIPSRKVVAIFFSIAFVLFSTFDPVSLPAVQARQGGTESLSGWLTIIRGDSQDGSTKDIPVLAVDDGQSVPLLLDDIVTEPAGGLLALDRQQITVNGEWSGALSDQGGREPFRVTSIAPLPEADVASAAVTGSKKWISIMCKFKDYPAEPNTLSYFQNMYMNSHPGLDHFWREQSYNLINTLGSTAVGWYTLPHARSYYMSGSSFNLDLAAIECTGVANASVNFTNYAGINLMFNHDLDGFAWGGGSILTLDGVKKVWNMTWEPPWGYQNIAVLGHEMGHALGLPHSSGMYGETYDNEWDVMSDTWTGCYKRGFADPTYGCLGQHTIAFHKDKLGWIPAVQKTTVGAGSAKTLVLEQLALPQTTNLKMVKIPMGGSSTRFYTVEARRLTGYDAQLAGSAVIIHEVDTNRYSSPAHVVDIDNNGITGDEGAMWKTGEIFRDATNKVAVAVLARTATGFRVHVTSGMNIYYITGSIGVSNVTVKYTGGSTITDATGRYIFPVSKGWSGTVTPSKAGYIFSPASRTYTNVTADKKAQNFSASPFYSISGNTGVAGTKLSYTSGTPRTATSQVNGKYALTLPGGWTGLIMPSHPCYTFSPANRGYASLAGNKTSQNYAPTFNTAAGCADISTWIGTPKRGRFGLPAGASTRANFASVDSGPVEIVSTNNIPLIAAERVMYKVNGVDTSFSEMMGLPNSQLDTIYWLPWYNSKTLDTQLRLANVSEADASVHVSIGGAEVPGSPFTIAAGASLRKSFPNIDKGPVRIESDFPIVVSERVLYKVNGVDTSFTEMMAMPASQLDTIYWLPWYNNKTLNTQLRLANVSDTDASVHVSIGGVDVPDSPFTLAPGASIRRNFAGVDAGPVRIESDVDILVSERVLYKVNGVDTSFSEMMALPRDQLSTLYWLPWYNNKTLGTQLRIANVSDQPALVHVTIGGVEVPDSPYALAVGESKRLNIAGIDKGPVRVESDFPIVVSERVLYNVNGVDVSFSEMMGMPDALLDATYWIPWYNNVTLDTQLRFGVP